MATRSAEATGADEERERSEFYETKSRRSVFSGESVLHRHTSRGLSAFPTCEAHDHSNMARVTMCSGVSASQAARPSTFSCRRTASVAGAVRFRAPSVTAAGCHHKARGSSAVRAELPSPVPEDSADALGRFRKVMTVLYAAGGALHFPDLLGQGPISSACGTSSFAELSPLLQAVTAGWAFLGPAASFGLATGKPWGDVIVVAVASCEVVLGIDFADAMAPSPIPAPVVAAQVTSLASVFAIYLWKRFEEGAEEQTR